MGDEKRRKRRLARLFRAESLKTQTEVAAEMGVDRTVQAHYEDGRCVPPREHLEQLAASARLTVAAGEEILELSDTLRQPRLRQGRGAEDLLAELGDTSHAQRAWQRFLRLRLPDPPPMAEDRMRAREQLAQLKGLTESQRLGVVRVALEFQTWALAEQAVKASAEAADLREARAWARLAVEIARSVRGTEAWRNRVQGFALNQEARVLEAAADRAATAERATRLWRAGADPDGLLGAGGGLGKAPGTRLSSVITGFPRVYAARPFFDHGRDPRRIGWDLLRGVPLTAVRRKNGRASKG
jgi:transcriptional regulator with XRE-family HTH domain